MQPRIPPMYFSVLKDVPEELRLRRLAFFGLGEYIRSQVDREVPKHPRVPASPSDFEIQSTRP